VFLVKNNKKENNMTKTIEQHFKSDIKNRLMNEKFITIDILYDLCKSRNDLCNDKKLKLVVDFLKVMNLEFIKYSDYFTDSKFHANCKGFHNNIAERRKRKIQQINKSIQNNK